MKNFKITMGLGKGANIDKVGQNTFNAETSESAYVMAQQQFNPTGKLKMKFTVTETLN